MTKRSKYFSKNKARLIRSGPDFFKEMVWLIEGAQQEIHLQTYILEEDATGHRIVDALITAAQRGVKVFLLPDAYGSGQLKSETVSSLRNAGVEIRFFGPLFSKGRIHFGRRLHHKIIIADRSKAMVAGINISNNYSGNADKLPWLDFGVLVEGDVLPSLVKICQRTWAGFHIKKLSTKPNPFLNVTSTPDDSFTTMIQPIENDGLRGKYQCTFSYLKAIGYSRDSITIVGGYFLPGGRARRALKRAILRGVQVRVILPSKSDVGLMHRGMQYLYAWMLRHRIEVYEYLPSNVHGKVIIADKQLVSIGSYDLNNLSTYSNIELNLEIMNQPFAENLSHQLDYVATNQCHKITITELEKRYSVIERLKQWYSYRVVKIMFVLATWLTNKNDEP